MRDVPRNQYRFHGFHLDARDRLLTRNGETLRLEPKSFDVLWYLLRNAGHLVSKNDLVDAVWARPFVSDNSLTRCIHQIRSVLQDDADHPTFIETVPGSGYRFIATVEAHEVPDPAQQSFRARRPGIAGIVIAVFLAGVVAWMAMESGFNKDAPPVERLAVLPLTNLTGAEEQEYFVQGVHDALIAELSRIESVEVISRTSVMGFQETDLGIPEIAKRLDVDAVVEGSVMRAGDNLTVTAQLIATNPERHLWAERYHRDVSELFEIATEIVAAIATEIELELVPGRAGAGAGAGSPVNRDAYDAYLLGRFHLERRSPESYRLAREQFQLAIELDSSFAAAHAGLAHTFGSAAIFGAIKPEAGFLEARRLAERAVQLDDSLAEGHVLLAGVAFYWDWDAAEAEQRIRHALSLNPNLAHAHRLLAEVYSVAGRHDEALNAIEKGRAIDPLPPTAQVKPALILYLARDYDAAIARAEAAMAHYPGFWQGHWLLCVSLAATDRYEEAVASCQQAVELSGNSPMAAGALGYALALAGQTDAANKIAADLEAHGESTYVGPASIAMIYGALGRLDEAFEHLETAFRLRDQNLVHAEHAATFDSLRSDPRFQSLRDPAFAAGRDNQIITTE